MKWWWVSPASPLETPLSIWRPQLAWAEQWIIYCYEHCDNRLDKITCHRSVACLTCCREGRWSHGNRASLGCSPGACAGSDWHLALSGSQPCPGTPQVIEWQGTMRSLPLWGDCGLVRWLGSGWEMLLGGMREQNSVKTYATEQNVGFWEMWRFSPTCSPGPWMIREGHRGRPLLGNGEQVCIGPIGQSWAGRQNTHLQTAFTSRPAVYRAPSLVQEAPQSRVPVPVLYCHHEETRSQIKLSHLVTKGALREIVWVKAGKA